MTDIQKVIAEVNEFLAAGHWQDERTTLMKRLVTELEEAHKEIERLSLLFEEISEFRGNGKSVNWCYGQSLEIANKALHNRRRVFE